MIPVLRRLTYFGGYLYSFLAVGLCAAFAVIANVLRLPADWTQGLAAGLVRGLVCLMRTGGAATFDFTGLERLRHRRGVIFAANHPTYLDALLLFGSLDRVLCVMKPSLRRNPALAQIARAAGYLDAESPRQLVAACRDRLAAGANLLVFPEGTRSAGARPRRFKPGFAHVAVRTPAPVIAIHVEAPPGAFMRKGHPFLQPWLPLPFRYRFRLGEEFTPDPGETTRAFLARVEASFQRVAEVAR